MALSRQEVLNSLKLYDWKRTNVIWREIKLARTERGETHNLPIHYLYKVLHDLVTEGYAAERYRDPTPEETKVRRGMLIKEIQLTQNGFEYLTQLKATSI